MRALLLSGCLLPALLAAGCGYPERHTALAPISATDRLPDARRNQWTTLKGRLIRPAGRNHYVFSDGLGETLVEVPPAAAQGRSFAPGTEVEVRGVVTRSGVEAETVTIAEPQDASSAFGPSKPPIGDR